MTAVFVLLGRAAASQAAPGSLRILFADNLPAILDASIVPAIAAEPGVAKVDTVDTSKSTPSPATLATYDLVVSVGDTSYNDPVAWGNELADYLDAGGAVIQFAYDNWESSGAHPTGRFESGGYAPFVSGQRKSLDVPRDHPGAEQPAVGRSDNPQYQRQHHGLACLRGHIVGPVGEREQRDRDQGSGRVCHREPC